MNIKYFLKGFFCIKSADSPAIALFASFVAIGALFKSIGLNIQESIFSTFLTYALPGSLIMAESLIVGASLLNIFLAVWLACHFIAVSAWLIMKKNYRSIERKYRLDYWIGVGAANLSVAISATAFGFFIADYLNKDMMVGLAIVNPVYFTCVMVGAMKTIQMSLAVILGSVLGISFYFVSPEWCILLGGFTAGTLAFFIGEMNGN
jgi:predicted branched-subunit amino acid permease